jgi:hypothetical protein
MLSKDFKEFIELLNEHNVRYLVTGTRAIPRILMYGLISHLKTLITS